MQSSIGTGTGRLAARFQVLRAGQMVFDKELSVDPAWESSFLGAAAIPAAMNHYETMYKSLVAQLIDDADLRKAMAR